MMPKKTAPPTPAARQQVSLADAPKAGKAVATIGADSFSAHAGAGLENVTARDLLIPRLTILQALSPQLARAKPEFIKGAAQGDICDVGTGEVFNDKMPGVVQTDDPGKFGIMFLPVHFRKDYLEWAPRSSGKGLVAIHNNADIVNECSRDEKGKLTLPNGNLIVETAQFFGFNLSVDARRCFIPMSSTQLKKARRWTTLASDEKLTRSDGSTFTPPLFYRTYILMVAEEMNNQGSWFGWRVDRGPALPEIPNWQELREASLKFRDSLLRGEVKADTTTMEAEATSGDDGDTM